VPGEGDAGGAVQAVRLTSSSGEDLGYGDGCAVHPGTPKSVAQWVELLHYTDVGTIGRARDNGRICSRIKAF